MTSHGPLCDSCKERNALHHGGTPIAFTLFDASGQFCEPCLRVHHTASEAFFLEGLHLGSGQQREAALEQYRRGLKQLLEGAES